MPSFLPTAPNDSLASNYLLDGYSHELEYGKAIRERPGMRPVPPVSNVSHIPGDIVGQDMEAQDQLVVGDLASVVGNLEHTNLDIDLSSDRTAFDLPFEIEDKDSGLRDGQGIIHHEWQEATQDPSRLPFLVSDSIAELEQLWGPTSTGTNLRQGALRELVRVAMRRSAVGQALPTIRAQLEGLAKDSWPKIESAFNAIAVEHGLSGQVYIRASAFPGLHRGKHASLLRKLASRCRYLVGGTKEAAEALGLHWTATVEEIPWDEAFKHFVPKLARQGKTVGGKEPPRRALQAAFLGNSKISTTPNSFPQAKARPQPIPVLPESTTIQARREMELQQRQWQRVAKVADRLVKAGFVTKERVTELRQGKTPEEFQRMLATEASKPKESRAYQGPKLVAAPVVTNSAQVLSVEDFHGARKQHQARHQVEALVAKMVRQGAVNSERATELSKMSSMMAVRAAVRATQVPESREYTESFRYQDANLRRASFEETQRQRQQAQAKAEEKDRQIKQVRAKVARLQKGAAMGEDLESLVPRLFLADEMRVARKAIDLILARAKAKPNAQEARPYRGKVYTAHQSAAKSGGVDKTLEKAQRWLLQTLHQTPGTSIDPELTRRFASVASDPSLVQIRTKHAGKAGQKYIDAAAFATPTGVAGCEKAAHMLRRAPARVVIAMDRCEGCSHRNAHGDCRKYRRPLVASTEAVV